MNWLMTVCLFLVRQWFNKGVLNFSFSPYLSFRLSLSLSLSLSPSLSQSNGSMGTVGVYFQSLSLPSPVVCLLPAVSALNRGSRSGGRGRCTHATTCFSPKAYLKPAHFRGERPDLVPLERTEEENGEREGKKA